MTPEPEWPEWLRDALPDAQRAFEGITNSHARLAAAASPGLIHSEIVQDQITRVTDDFIQKGYVTTSGDAVGLGSQVPDLPRSILAAFRANQASSRRMLRMFVAANRIVVVRLLDGLHFALSNDDLVLALVCVRGCLEHIATFWDVVRSLEDVPSPSSSNEATEALERVDQMLVQSCYQTRVDWAKVVQLEQSASLSKKDVAYRPDDKRVDRTASTVLNAVDRLSKDVPGTRAVYEVLCEFAHPNVGFVLGCVEHLRERKDAQGVRWIDKQLGLGAPRGFVQGLRKPLTLVFSQLARVLAVYEESLDRAAAQADRLLSMIQLSMRRLSRSDREIYGPYDLCPCGSQKKYKFCCRDAPDQ